MARPPSARTRRAADAPRAWREARATGAPPPDPGEPAEPGAPPAHAEAPAAAVARLGSARPDPDGSRPAVAPAHTDWLYHHLRIEGPAEPIAEFRGAAAGAGLIPWQLDLDRLEEDFFHRLVAPPAGQARTLSLDGARLLAGELRDAVARRHALATARVGRSQACPFDLHALLPVPEAILRLGPDHPDSLAWLWTTWGTTQALRHVALAPASPSSRPGPADDATLQLRFWAADWTPWRALAAVRTRWPALRFAVTPQYALA